MRSIVVLVSAVVIASSAYASPHQDARANTDTVAWIVKQSGNKLTEKQAIRTLAALYAAADKHGVGRELVLRVAKAESHFNPKALSHKNAVGTMQVVCRWHKEKCGDKSLEIVENAADIGAQILREYLDLEKGNTTQALYRYNGLNGKEGVYARTVLGVKLPPGADGHQGLRVASVKKPQTLAQAPAPVKIAHAPEKTQDPKPAASAPAPSKRQAPKYAARTLSPDTTASAPEAKIASVRGKLQNLLAPLVAYAKGRVDAQRKYGAAIRSAYAEASE